MALVGGDVKDRGASYGVDTSKPDVDEGQWKTPVHHNEHSEVTTNTTGPSP